MLKALFALLLALLVSLAWCQRKQELQCFLGYQPRTEYLFKSRTVINATADNVHSQTQPPGINYILEQSFSVIPVAGKPSRAKYFRLNINDLHLVDESLDTQTQRKRSQTLLKALQEHPFYFSQECDLKITSTFFSLLDDENSLTMKTSIVENLSSFMTNYEMKYNSVENSSHGSQLSMAYTRSTDEQNNCEKISKTIVAKKVPMLSESCTTHACFKEEGEGLIVSTVNSIQSVGYFQEEGPFLRAAAQTDIHLIETRNLNASLSYLTLSGEEFIAEMQSMMSNELFQMSTLALTHELRQYTEAIEQSRPKHSADSTEVRKAIERLKTEDFHSRIESHRALVQLLTTTTDCVKQLDHFAKTEEFRELPSSAKQALLNGIAKSEAVGSQDLLVHLLMSPMSSYNDREAVTLAIALLRSPTSRLIDVLKEGTIRSSETYRYQCFLTLGLIVNRLYQMPSRIAESQDLFLFLQQNLEKAVKEDDQVVAEVLLFALENARHADALPSIKSSLASSFPGVRAAAVSAMKNFDLPAAATLVAEKLQDSEPYVRQMAVGSLLKLQSLTPEVEVAIVEAFMSESNPSVKRELLLLLTRKAQNGNNAARSVLNMVSKAPLYFFHAGFSNVTYSESLCQSTTSRSLCNSRGEVRSALQERVCWCMCSTGWKGSNCQELDCDIMSGQEKLDCLARYALVRDKQTTINQQLIDSNSWLFEAITGTAGIVSSIQDTYSQLKSSSTEQAHFVAGAAFSISVWKTDFSVFESFLRLFATSTVCNKPKGSVGAFMRISDTVSRKDEQMVLLAGVHSDSCFSDDPSWSIQDKIHESYFGIVELANTKRKGSIGILPFEMHLIMEGEVSLGYGLFSGVSRTQAYIAPKTVVSATAQVKMSVGAVETGIRLSLTSLNTEVKKVVKPDCTTISTTYGQLGGKVAASVSLDQAETERSLKTWRIEPQQLFENALNSCNGTTSGEEDSSNTLALADEYEYSSLDDEDEVNTLAQATAQADSIAPNKMTLEPIYAAIEESTGAPYAIKQGKICVLQSALKNIQTGWIARIPGECEPARNLMFSVANAQGGGRMDVLKTAMVLNNHYQGLWTSVAGIAYSTLPGTRLTFPSHVTSYMDDPNWSDPATYVVEQGVCFVNGLAVVQRSVSNLILVLPNDCRPASKLSFSLNQYSTTIGVDVFSSGEVLWSFGGGSLVSLSGIIFPVNTAPTVSVVLSGGYLPSSYGGVRYMKSGYICYIFGIATASYTSTSKVLTLPPSCRPTQRTSMLLNNGEDNNSRAVLVDFLPSGEVLLQVGPSSVSFSTTVFHTDVDGYTALSAVDPVTSEIGLNPYLISYGGEFGTVSVSRQSHICILQGRISVNRYQLNLAMIPDNCKPLGALVFKAASSGDSTRVDIGNGAIQNIRKTSWTSISGLAWTTLPQKPIALPSYTTGVADPYFAPISYSVADGICFVRGLARLYNVQYASILMTLPEECRPAYPLVFNFIKDEGVDRVDVHENGNLVWIAGSNSDSALSFSGLTFPVAATSRVKLQLGPGIEALTPVTYTKAGSVCFITGFVRRSNCAMRLILTLPPACRPTQKHSMSIYTSSQRIVDISPSGEVTYFGDVDQVSLSTISFVTDVNGYALPLVPSRNWMVTFSEYGKVYAVKQGNLCVLHGRVRQEYYLREISKAPAGCAPPKSMLFSTASSESVSGIELTQQGTVDNLTPNSWVSLAGIAYSSISNTPVDAEPGWVATNSYMVQDGICFLFVRSTAVKVTPLIMVLPNECRPASIHSFILAREAGISLVTVNPDGSVRCDMSLEVVLNGISFPVHTTTASQVSLATGYSHGTTKVQYYKSEFLCFVSGDAVASSASTSLVATLPPTCRPKQTLTFLMHSFNKPIHVKVSSSGQISIPYLVPSLSLSTLVFETNIYSHDCPSSEGQICAGKGTCSTDRTCNCQQGYFSFNCALTCADTPNGKCSGKGDCVWEENAGVSCKCHNGYAGEKCQFECPKACSNKGTCVFEQALQQAVCKCPLGFTGNACEKVGGAAGSAILLKSDIKHTYPNTVLESNPLTVEFWVKGVLPSAKKQAILTIPGVLSVALIDNTLSPGFKSPLQFCSDFKFGVPKLDVFWRKVSISVRFGNATFEVIIRIDDQMMQKQICSFTKKGPVSFVLHKQMIYDEFRVWNLPFDQLEDYVGTFNTRMATSQSSEEPGLLSYFAFDEFAGDVAYDEVLQRMQYPPMQLREHVYVDSLVPVKLDAYISSSPSFSHTARVLSKVDSVRLKSATVFLKLADQTATYNYLLSSQSMLLVNSVPVAQHRNFKNVKIMENGVVTVYMKWEITQQALHAIKPNGVNLIDFQIKNSDSSVVFLRLTVAAESIITSVQPDNYFTYSSSTSTENKMKMAPSAEMTFAAWIRRQSADNSVLLRSSTEPNDGYQVDLNSFELFLPNKFTSTSMSLPTNSWYHYAIAFGASTVRVLINGVQVNTYSVSSTNIKYTDALSFVAGLKSGAGLAIDELAVFSRAITNDNIRGMMIGGINQNQEGLAALLNFEATSVDATDVEDDSGNGNRFTFAMPPQREALLSLSHTWSNCPGAEEGLKYQTSICQCTYNPTLKHFYCPGREVRRLQTDIATNPATPYTLVLNEQYKNGEYGPARYIKYGSMCILEGYLTKQAYSPLETRSDFVVLPAECTPAAKLIFNVHASASSHAKLTLASDSKAYLELLSADYFSISGIAYFTQTGQLLTSALINQWKAYGNSYLEPQFLRQGSICVLQGAVTAPETARGLPIVQLPSNCRPKDGTLIFYTPSGDNGIKIEIGIDGMVLAQQGSATFTSLAGIAFDTEPTQKILPVRLSSNMWPKYARLGYSKLGSLCFLTGAVTSNYEIEVLPAFCRPSSRLVFNVGQYYSNLRVDIYPDGRTTVQGILRDEILSLSGIVFDTTMVEPTKLSLQLFKTSAAIDEQVGAPYGIKQGDVCIFQGRLKSTIVGWNAFLPTECIPTGSNIFLFNVATSLASGVGRMDTDLRENTKVLNGFQVTEWTSIAGIAYHLGAGISLALPPHVIFDSAFGPVKYNIQDGVCFVNGWVAVNTPTSRLILTLPNSCKPQTSLTFSLIQYDHPIRVDVNPNGDVMWAGDGSGWISLSGISFPVTSASTKLVELSSGYSHLSSSPIRFYKSGYMCLIIGVAVASTSATATVLVLPPSCRPAQKLMFSLNSYGNNNKATMVEVSTSGEVTLRDISSISLSSVIFATNVQGYDNNLSGELTREPLSVESVVSTTGGEYGTPSVARQNSICVLQGRMNVVSQQVDIGTLPTGCTPPGGTLVYMGVNGNTPKQINRIDLVSDGRIQSMLPSPWISISGIAFSVQPARFLLRSSLLAHYIQDSYYKDISYTVNDGVCMLAGMAFLTEESPKKVIILPEDCRPSYDMVFILNQHDNAIRVEVTPDGTVRWTHGLDVWRWVSFSGITFPVSSSVQLPLILSPEYASLNAKASYYKAGYVCFVSGQAISTLLTTSTKVLNLPPDCRPTQRLTMLMARMNGMVPDVTVKPVVVEVLPSGDVVLPDGVEAVSLSTMVFVTLAKGYAAPLLLARQSSLPPAEYGTPWVSKNGNICTLHGRIQVNEYTPDIAFIPLGCEPSALKKIFTIASSYLGTRMDLLKSGALTFGFYPNNWYSFSGIAYSTIPATALAPPSFAEYLEGVEVPGFNVEGDACYLTGLVYLYQRISPNTLIFTLPDKCRPADTLTFMTKVVNPIRIDIHPNGEIKATYCEVYDEWMTLAGISFPVFSSAPRVLGLETGYTHMSNSPVKYLKSGYLCFVTGSAVSSSQSKVVLTLPPSCRPTQQLQFVRNSNALETRFVELSPSGELVLPQGPATISLSTIVFQSSIYGYGDDNTVRIIAPMSSNALTEYGLASIVRRGHVCVVQGVLTAPSPAAVVANIPPICRPTDGTLLFATGTNENEEERFEVQPTGNVMAFFASKTWFAASVVYSAVPGNLISIDVPTTKLVNGYRPAAYYVESGICFVSGNIALKLSTDETFLNLPVACRPFRKLHFFINHALVVVEPDGRLYFKILNMKSNWMTLSGLAFPVTSSPTQVVESLGAGYVHNDEDKISYSKVGPFCYLYGKIVINTSNSLLMTLPQECRPVQPSAFQLFGGAGQFMVKVETDGSIRKIAGNILHWFTVSGIVIATEK